MDKSFELKPQGASGGLMGPQMAFSLHSSLVMSTLRLCLGAGVLPGSCQGLQEQMSQSHRRISRRCRSNVCLRPPSQAVMTPARQRDQQRPSGGTHTADMRRKAGILPSLEDLLFYTIAEGQEKIPAHKFTTSIMGVVHAGQSPMPFPRAEMGHRMSLNYSSPYSLHIIGILLRWRIKPDVEKVFRNVPPLKMCVQSNIVLLTQAFRKKFVIPDFQSFCAHMDELYVADYIPQLARFSPDLWAVALCTVDGQRHTVGDTKVPFCLQSCVKPLKYAIAVHDHGTEYVHRFIGKEPSGLRFNKLFLNEEDKPHNPMVNAGAIVCTSLIKTLAAVHSLDTSSPPVAKREIKHSPLICCSALQVMNFMNKLAGNEYVGFSNATFQSERESGDRNFAIGYYLKEKKLCSIEVTCESASVMAATLANGGFCPITGERVLSPESVRDTLSLMHSCGMYDFSGQFAFHVGLPAKSGVAGGILLVVPNVMGIMCWSPPLDKLGNSVRGIQFCTDLVSLCNFHNYDNLRHFAKKLDPRREGGDQRVKSVINLLFAAYTGDVSALRRWGNTPMDEAVHFGHHDVLVSQHVELLLAQASLGDRGELPAEDLGQLGPLGRRRGEEELQILRMRGGKRQGKGEEENEARFMVAT
ncbi:hypothetical protein FQN60_006711, partial [Etheostoma spectabile]